jgi:hypothetical protein
LSRWDKINYDLLFVLFFLSLFSIPYAPTVLQLGSFHHLSKVEPWDLIAYINVCFVDLPVVTIVTGFFNIVDLLVATIVMGFFNVVFLMSCNI